MMPVGLKARLLNDIPLICSMLTSSLIPGISKISLIQRMMHGKSLMNTWFTRDRYTVIMSCLKWEDDEGLFGGYKASSYLMTMLKREMSAAVI